MLDKDYVVVAHVWVDGNPTPHFIKACGSALGSLFDHEHSEKTDRLLFVSEFPPESIVFDQHGAITFSEDHFSELSNALARCRSDYDIQATYIVIRVYHHSIGCTIKFGKQIPRLLSLIEADLIVGSYPIFEEDDQ